MVGAEQATPRTRRCTGCCSPTTPAEGVPGLGQTAQRRGSAAHGDRRWPSRLPVGHGGERRGRRRRGSARPTSAPSSTRPGSRPHASTSAWRRTSYSALTAAAHDAAPAVAQRAGGRGEGRRAGHRPRRAAPRASCADVASPMAALPGGTAFGTLVHAVLEELDPQAGDLADEVAEQRRRQLARSGPADLDPASSPPRCCRRCAPRSARCGGRPLAELAPCRPARRAGVRTAAARRRPARPAAARLRELAPLLRAHLPRRRPARGYADLLEDPVLGDAPLRGYLDRQHRRGAARGRAVRGRSTTRPTGWAIPTRR